MTPWMDAIDKLRFFGYSITLEEGKLKYAYREEGNPPQDEITPLLEVLKAHREEILNDPYFLVEQTLCELNERWEPGALKWMERNQPKDLERMKTLEEKINQLALDGNLSGLKGALEDYKGLMLGIVKALGASKRGQKALF